MTAIAAPFPAPAFADAAPAAPRHRAPADLRTARALHERRPNAMALFMESHGRALLGYLIQTLRDRATAEDVLQQVLLEIWQRAPTYDPERASLLTWALTIARSRAIDQLRRRIPEPVDPVTAGARLDAGARMEDESERMLERWRIAGLLERLPGDHSLLLRLRFYEGLSQTEIAERTGVPVGTVKTRMVRGLAQLRSLIEAEPAVA